MSIDPSSFGLWVAAAFIVLGAVSTIANLAAIFATRRELEQLEKRIGTLEGRFDSLAAEFGRALRDMPAQIVSVLRNTGALDKPATKR